MLGQTLSHYAILELLGEGPNGATYKARDERTQLHVALKILRPGLDPEKRALMEREARATAALNHPYIAQLIEVGSAGGHDFLVREYCSGDSLATEMSRKRLRRKYALTYSLQIAEALAAAHHIGYMHGAIKASNVIILGPRRCKLTDFGAGRLSEGVPYAPGNLPAHTTADSVSCLAPEQVEGKAVDQRSDIFAFAALLYHMSTGRAPFRKDSPVSTIESILREEPKPIQAVTSRPPYGLEKVFDRCLSKDPGRRPDDLSHYLATLRKLRDDYESGVEARGSFLSENWERVMQVVFALIVTAALAGGAIFYLKTRNRNTPVRATLTQVTPEQGLASEPAISGKGEWVAFASDRGSGNLDIWVQAANGRESRRLTSHAADDHEPTFSPDGSQIAFRSERDGGGIYVIPIQGGPEHLVAREGRRPRYSPDGRSIAYWVGPPGMTPGTEGISRMFIVDAKGGPATPLRDEFAVASYPVWAPDGQHLLFLGRMDADPGRGEPIEWWMVPLRAGSAINTGACSAMRRSELIESGQCPIPGDWNGEQVMFSRRRSDASNLYVARISITEPRMAEAPRQLTSGKTLEIQPCVADDGRFAFASQVLNADVWGLPVSVEEGKAAGEPRRITTEKSDDFYPTVPDSNDKLLYLSNRGGNQVPWLLDLKSRKNAAVTTATQDQLWPRISRDGSKLAFTEQRIRGFEHFVAPIGVGTTNLLCADCTGLIYDWTADSRALLAGHRLKGWPFPGIVLIKIESSEKLGVLNHPEHPVIQARLSHDNRWVTFVVNLEGGRSQIWLAPFHAAAQTPNSEWIPVTDGTTWDSAPQLSPGGRMIYYTSGRDGSRCIWGRHLDPQSGRPTGEVFAVYHFHSARLSPALVPFNGIDLFVTADQLLIGLGELSGSIWTGRMSL